MSGIGNSRQASLSWLPAQEGNVPYNAITAANGLFIARVRIENDVTPGKVKIGHKTGYFPYGGKENCIEAYEVLCDTGLHVFGPETVWVNETNGNVPSHAVLAGHTHNNEPLYICRAEMNGEMCVGKVCQSYGCAFIPYGGAEHIIYNYDVLCFSS